MTIEDLKETAALARLNLDESELVAAFPAFEEMLNFFAVMQTADEDQSDNFVTVNSGFFRPDTPGNNTQTGEHILSNAGKRDGRFLVIPNVLEK